MVELIVFQEAFVHLEDPRARNVTYPLINVVFMGLVGMLCGADDWAEVHDVCVLKREFLGSILEFNGIPSPDTFERVFSMLDPEQFSRCLQDWAEQVTGSFAGKHIAVDGKAQRASIIDPTRCDFFHATSLFLADSGLFLAVRGSRGSGHEVADAKALLEPLALEGAYVTMDALHTSTLTAQFLHKRGAFWLLPLKGNCPARLAEVELLFETMEADEGWRHEQLDKGHGRLERRDVWSAPLIGDWFGNQSDWHGLASFVRIERTRTTLATNTTQHEVRYFLSSVPAEEAEQLHALIRGHWAIENNGHWLLDVLLREDHSRARKANSAANIAVLKRFTLNLLKRVPVGPTALKRKRLAAQGDNSYLLRVLRRL